MIETPNLKLKIPEPTDATDNPYYFKDGFNKIDTAVAELGDGKAEATHTHDGVYAPSSHNHDTRYVISAKNLITQSRFDDFSYPYSYMGVVNGVSVIPDSPITVGLPQADWFHIIYIPHASAGYGTQILTTYHGRGWMYVRSASETAWGPWRIVYTEETITCSNAVPTYFIGEGAQHQVYS